MQSASVEPSIASVPFVPVRGRYYVLAVLTMISTLCYLDRQILVILQEPIKLEMGLSDTELGLLNGFAFVLLYVICGVPLAHLADRMSRRNIIGGSVVVWSTMTALMGVAPNYTAMVLTRIGVGVGEAGAQPSSHSMVADLFPPRERATALATILCGYPLGILIGFLFGAFIGELYGWRVAFILAGMPGLLITLLLFTTVREPVRLHRKSEHANQGGFWKSLCELWGLKSFRAINFIVVATGIANNGIYAFGSLFLMRVHGLSLTQVGTLLALIYGIAGMVGPLTVAAVVDRLAQRDRRWRLWAPAIISTLMLPLALGTFFAPTVTLSVMFYVGVGTLVTSQISPIISIMQQVVPARRIALGSAVVNFVNNFMGAGVGALLVGVVSDLLQPRYGNLSLRYALGGSSMFYLLAVFVILYAARVIGRGDHPGLIGARTP